MITAPYLLVLNIPLHRHDGRYWADPLWRKDLEAHPVHIAAFAIACPVVAGAPPANWEAVDISAITVHPLPAMGRLAALALPQHAWRLWRAMAPAAIVHTGVAGWPFPLGWIAIPLARLRGRFTVLVIESAFWRIPPGTAASPLTRLRAGLWERINRSLVRRCDATFFTSEGYRATLGSDASGTAHVLPAVWIDEEQLIAPERLAMLAEERAGRLLFAGRLTAAKGVAVLLAAVVRSGVAVDFVGDGDMREEIMTAHRARPDLVRLLDPVDYGAAFSALLDGYAALVVPTLSDEQPRIIFDAFARGLPVLASDTPGNRQVVDHGRTGLLYPPGDAAALALVLRDAIADPVRLNAMAGSALAGMATRTHAAMHRERATAIAALVAGK